MMFSFRSILCSHCLLNLFIYFFHVRSSKKLLVAFYHFVVFHFNSVCVITHSNKINFTHWEIYHRFVYMSIYGVNNVCNIKVSKEKKEKKKICSRQNRRKIKMRCIEYKFFLFYTKGYPWPLCGGPFLLVRFDRYRVAFRVSRRHRSFIL